MKTQTPPVPHSFNIFTPVQVKEVDMGLAADVGTLQRLPKFIGSQSLVSELCLTARSANPTNPTPAPDPPLSHALGFCFLLSVLLHLPQTSGVQGSLQPWPGVPCLPHQARYAGGCPHLGQEYC